MQKQLDCTSTPLAALTKESALFLFKLLIVIPLSRILSD